MHSGKFLRLFLALPLTLIFLTGCGPSQEEKMQIAQTACATIMATRKFESSKRIEVLNKAREEVGDYDYPYPLSDDMLWFSLSYGGTQSCIDLIIKPPPPPPKTKAELEAEAAAAEARAKRAEEERIAKEKAEAEAKRKAEEIAKYITENTKSTYLYCPSLKEKKNLGPEEIALVEIKKIEGDKTKLEELDISNEYLASTVYFEIPMFEPVSNSCYSSDAFKQTVAGEDFCLGKQEKDTPKQTIWNADEYYDAAKSSSFGNPVLKWGYGDFYVDRKTLIASHSKFYLGSTTSYYADEQYQCSVIAKDVYEQKIKEISDKVKIEADKLRATLEEKQSEETQI